MSQVMFALAVLKLDPPQLPQAVSFNASLCSLLERSSHLKCQPSSWKPKYKKNRLYPGYTLLCIAGFFPCLFTCMSTASLSSVTVFWNADILSSLDCLLLSGSSCGFYSCFLSRLASKMRHSTLISFHACWWAFFFITSIVLLTLAGDPFHSPDSLQQNCSLTNCSPAVLTQWGFFPCLIVGPFIYPCQIASYFYQDTTSLWESLGILPLSVSICQLLTSWCYLQIDKAVCHLGLCWQYQIPWGLEQISAEP